jgi:hypothetical protein
MSQYLGNEVVVAGSIAYIASSPRTVMGNFSWVPGPVSWVAGFDGALGILE